MKAAADGKIRVTHMAFFSRKVDVRFVDAATGKVFAKTSMPPGDLPESFLIDTTMTMSGTEYSVVRAEPPTRAEYAKSKRLVLTLARVERIDPHDLLFSLPTIAGRLPDEEGAATGSEYELLEDDWRQLEFVHVDLRSAVEKELDAIRGIWNGARKGNAFTTIHTREAIESPLLSGVPLEGISGALRFHGHGLRVQGGFARPLPAGGTLYGIQRDGRVLVLGVQLTSEPPSPELIAELESLGQRCNAILVDWCGGRLWLSRVG